MESAFPSNSSHFELLARLLDHAGEVVTRGALRRELWPGDTFVDFEHGLNVAIARVREALGDEADHPRFVETLPKRGYRFIAPVERTTPCAPRRKGHAMAWVALAIGLGGVAAIGVVQMRRQPVLTDRDTILVADFVNKTGDEVFNDTLRQALTVDLEQSPFLSVVSHERVRETLKQMTRSAEERVVGTVAREVCQRVGAGASVSGSIAALGTHFVLDIDAVSCASGNTVAHAQQEALGREQVIKALGAAATRLRPRLGESQASLRQFDLPLEQATTPSLEALKAFSLGVATRARVSEAKAIPFFRRAIELDPDFAMAHAILGTIYSNVGPYDEAIRYTRSAYERRNRATDRERFYIEAHACEFIVVEPDCYLNAHEVWKRTYPRDWRLVHQPGERVCVARPIRFSHRERQGSSQAEPRGCLSIHQTSRGLYGDQSVR